MDNDKTFARFQKKVFTEFGQNSGYDKLFFNLTKIYRVFSETPGFDKIPFRTKYQLILQASIIATASSTVAMNKFSIFNRKLKNPEYYTEYAQDFGFEDPARIDITPGQKLLNKNDDLL